MLFKEGHHISERTSALLRRNTSTNDYIKSASFSNVSSSTVRNVLFRQVPVTYQSKVALNVLAVIAYGNIARRINQLTEDRTQIIDELEMSEDLIEKELKALDLTPLYE